MQHWKSWASVLSALVLSLGLLVGMAAAEDHPGCENSDNQAGHCEENDGQHPGNPDDDNGGGEEPPAPPEDPTGPIADGCDEVVTALSDNVDPAFEDGRQVCDAIRGDGGGEPPAPPEDPTGPIADGCDEVIDQLEANGAPPEVEEGRAVCDAIGGGGGALGLG